MALPVANAAPLKLEIRLVQALSEFEAILPDDQKTKLRAYRGQLPNSTGVMRFTAEIDMDASRNRKSRQCVGTRLTNVLHVVQQFYTGLDAIVGSSQSQIAGVIWGTLKISLQLASAVSSYFDQLTTLFMRIGLTSPRYQDFGLLYPESTRLQRALCEYFVIIVCLCKQAVLFLEKPFWSQLSCSIFNPFNSEFGSFQQDLENLACAIQQEVSLASKQEQQNEAKEMSRFRTTFFKNLSYTSAQEIRKTRARKGKKAELRFLNACSTYNHERSWKQARKNGNTQWIFDDAGYKQWKEAMVSSTLWCTGILGSGKTVLSANVVEDLKITTPASVSYFFCRHDEAKSLQTRTIIGSLARQIFDHVKSDIVDTIAEMRFDTLSTDKILEDLQELLPSNSIKYFIIIDGLDECEKKERKQILECLQQLTVSKQVFGVYCSSRPDVSRWAHTFLEPQWNVSMSKTSADILAYVEDTLVKHLESGSLFVGDSTIIFTIQDALSKNAHGMFLWLVFQIDSICSQETDEAILTALEDLPKDLPNTFNRILRKLQHSDAANPQFCKRVFDLVAAAQRPLTLEELREAVSVNPGDTSWDASKMVNDMLKSLLNSCGSLVAVDEEHQTVHFTHHSVKQHLLSEPTDSNLKKYHITTQGSDQCLGDVIVTYLNFGIFDRQLAKTKSAPMLPRKNYPSAILDGSLPRSSIASRLAVRLLKGRENSRFDIQSQLKIAAGMVDESEQIQPAHPFLPYAQEYWLFHTKIFRPAWVAGYPLWNNLVDERVKTIELPWAQESTVRFSYDFIQWIIQNEHWALIDRSLAQLISMRDPELFVHLHAAEGLLQFLIRPATDVDVQNINFEAVMYLASFSNRTAAVLLSLEKGANVNADVGFHGNALHVASRCGHKEILRLLVDHGANVHAQSNYYGSALQAASGTFSLNHHSPDRCIEIARILLESGVDVNAKDGSFGTALDAASKAGNEKMTGFLLANGAIATHKTMEAASSSGNEGVENMIRKALGEGHWSSSLTHAIKLGNLSEIEAMLNYGGDLEIQDEEDGTPLIRAVDYGQTAVVRLLLQRGGNPKALDAYDRTIIQIAAETDQIGILEILFEKLTGIDINAQGTGGRTALLNAVYNKCYSNIKILLANGARTDLRDHTYRSPLDLARQAVNPYFISLFTELRNQGSTRDEFRG